MKKLIISLGVLLSISLNGLSQVYIDSTINSSAKRILTQGNKLSIGSYGEAHYNQKINTGRMEYGKMDLHRIILYTSYKINKQIQFFSEIEFEHTNELSVEQAFLNYKINNWLNLKTGLILMPVGYVNEFHEPTLFNGVERPFVDKYIIPTTWSEMGAGFHGLAKKINVKYQIYLVNGLKSYSEKALITGKNGIRKARQNGSNAQIGAPAIVSKITYYGINKLRLGISGYYGKTTSSLYNNLTQNNAVNITKADSSTLGITLFSLNANYTIKQFQIRGEYIRTFISGTEAYNDFTNSDTGNQALGYYIDFSYKKKLNHHKMLLPFARFEHYNTHQSTKGDLKRNPLYNKTIYTLGIAFNPTSQVSFKADYQWFNAGNIKYHNQLNIGFGYWF